MKVWNQRYVAYAAAAGMTPEQRLATDKATWPVGCMTGFILWNMERWREWGTTGTSTKSPDDHRRFDAWLAAKYGAGQQLQLEVAP